MRLAVERAARFGVAVGAHPSYPDRAGFGRAAPRPRAPPILRARSAAQLDALARPRAPTSATSSRTARSTTRSARSRAGAGSRPGGRRPRRTRSGRPVPLLRSSAIALVERSRGRGGSAVRSRGLPRPRLPSRRRARAAGDAGDLLDDPAAVAERAVRLVARRRASRRSTAPGRRPHAASLCLHGDTPAAVAMARAGRAALDADGVSVRAPW